MSFRLMRKARLVALVLVAAMLLSACSLGGGGGQGASQAANLNLGQEAAAVMQERGLSAADVVSALKTYVPSGKRDEYLMFASGGHSGQVLVIGVPSMRLLKVIGVFTPEPWQGYGYSDDTKEILRQGASGEGKDHWGDTHHPALSETNGEYDGQWLFIGDKANGRLAVVDLRDFETKQIVRNPLFNGNHGATFVTPNTEYVVEGSQYGIPPGEEAAPLDQYKERYRGAITFWKFDRDKGRVDPAKSFAVEVPPYWQDLCDAGKGESEGWAFCTSINTELATGNFEAETAARDMDYLHMVNWRKAEELVAAGKAKEVNGFKVLPLEVAAREGALYFLPVPKSPHGVDVAPRGDYIVTSGKLDPHVTVYSWKKIAAAIEQGAQERDPYGVPVLNFQDVVEAQVEVGLGPLHTQFDDQGYAYTSLFLDSAIARWTLGPPYNDAENAWKLVSKVPVHYNVGHLAVAEGDTAKPAGKYLVAMNKWSIDRFHTVGPLHPQNFQLIDISKPGENMQLVYDMPIGLGEPHYAQIIRADKVKAWDVYPEVGWNPVAQAKDPNAVESGKERIERRGNTVEVWMTATRSRFTPHKIEVKKGDKVIIHITNIERAKDATHGFAIQRYGINLSLEPGETQTVTFVADQPGVYPFYCTEFCSALHLEMAGYLIVQP